MMRKRLTLAVMASLGVLVAATTADAQFRSRGGRDGGGWGYGRDSGFGASRGFSVNTPLGSYNQGYSNFGYGSGNYGNNFGRGSGWGTPYYGSNYGRGSGWGTPYYGNQGFYNDGFSLGMNSGWRGNNYTNVPAIQYSTGYNNPTFTYGSSSVIDPSISPVVTSPMYSNTTFTNAPSYPISSGVVTNPGMTYGNPVMSYGTTTSTIIGTPDSGMRQSFYPSSTVASDRAQLRIIVPSADAKVWIENQPMSVEGTDRLFTSPTLQPGSYVYTVKATWSENGREVSRQKQLTFQPGQAITADFNVADSQPMPAVPGIAPLSTDRKIDQPDAGKPANTPERKPDTQPDGK